MDDRPKPSAQDPRLPASPPPGRGGSGPLDEETGGCTLTVHGAAPAIAVEVRCAGRITEALTLAIEQSYLDSLGTASISPGPDAVSSDGLLRFLDFPAPGSPFFRVEIIGTASPSAAPLATGDLFLYVGGMHVASIDLATGRPR